MKVALFAAAVLLVGLSAGAAYHLSNRAPSAGDVGPNGEVYIYRPHTRPTFAADSSWNLTQHDVYIGWGPPARGITVYGAAGSQTLPVPQPQLPPSR